MTAPQAPVPPSPVAPSAPAPVAPAPQASVAPAVVAPADGAAQAEAPAAGRGRGRSRPADVVERDEKVLSAVTAEGITREAIAEATGLDSVRVYQSLWRLRRDGLVVRSRSGRTHHWMLASAAGSETAATTATKAESDATS